MIRGVARGIRAVVIGASALGIGCATAAPAPIVVAPIVASSPHSLVTAPLAARIVAPAPAPTPSDIAAASLVQRVADVAQSRDAGSPRRLVIPAAFRVADLPSFEPPRALDGNHPPVVAGGIDATELQLDGHATGKGPDKLDTPIVVRVGLITTTWARLQIGDAEAAIGPDAVGGVSLTCGGPQSIPQRLLPARWESVNVTPDRSVEYRITTAWFDPRTCSAHVMEHRAVTAAPLSGRLLYAFREPCLGACGGGERVTFLGPRFDTLATSAIGGSVSSAGGVLTRVTLPVRQGGGASMIGRATTTSAEAWARKLAVTLPSNNLVLGVEIAQGVADPEPVAIAYFGAPELDPSSPPSRR